MGKLLFVVPKESITQILNSLRTCQGIPVSILLVISWLVRGQQVLFWFTVTSSINLVYSCSWQLLTVKKFLINSL